MDHSVTSSFIMSINKHRSRRVSSSLHLNYSHWWVDRLRYSLGQVPPDVNCAPSQADSVDDTRQSCTDTTQRIDNLINADVECCIYIKLRSDKCLCGTGASIIHQSQQSITKTFIKTKYLRFVLIKVNIKCTVKTD